MRRLALIVALAALATPAAALGSEQHPTLAELEREVICPTCHTTLELSNAPVADRMRAFIGQEIAAGKTKSQIKDELVAQFGEGVLAAPRARGFNLLVWLLPAVGGIVAILVLGFFAQRWRERRAPPAIAAGPAANGNGRVPLDRDLERRLDEELARFDG